MYQDGTRVRSMQHARPPQPRHLFTGLISRTGKIKDATCWPAKSPGEWTWTTKTGRSGERAAARPDVSVRAGLDSDLRELDEGPHEVGVEDALAAGVSVNEALDVAGGVQRCVGGEEPLLVAHILEVAVVPEGGGHGIHVDDGGSGEVNWALVLELTGVCGVQSGVDAGGGAEIVQAVRERSAVTLSDGVGSCNLCNSCEEERSEFRKQHWVIHVYFLRWVDSEYCTIACGEGVKLSTVLGA